MDQLSMIYSTCQFIEKYCEEFDFDRRPEPCDFRGNVIDHYFTKAFMDRIHPDLYALMKLNLHEDRIIPYDVLIPLFAEDEDADE